MSGFLLDTNVISEAVKARPEPRVASWIAGVDEHLVYVSVLTLGEIRKGIALSSDPVRRARLEAWLAGDLEIRFAGRILSIDASIADRWGNLHGKAKASKRFLPVVDGLLAATALEHNLTLVTRNVSDVVETGV